MVVVVVVVVVMVVGRHPSGWNVLVGKLRRSRLAEGRSNASVVVSGGRAD